MRTKIYSKNNKVIDIKDWDTSGSVGDLYNRYGWEGAMAWGNLIHDELNDPKAKEKGFKGIEKNDVFLDIGANIGMSSIRAESCGASKIYAIEPDPDIFEALQKNKNENWVLENIAIDSEEGMLEISKWPNYWEFRSIKAITLDQYFQKQNIQKIDYMKVDIEGHEKTAFENVSQETWDKINKLFFEIHGFSDEEKINFIKFYNDKGFSKHHINLWGAQDFVYFWK